MTELFCEPRNTFPSVNRPRLHATGPSFTSSDYPPEMKNKTSLTNEFSKGGKKVDELEVTAS